MDEQKKRRISLSDLAGIALCIILIPIIAVNLVLIVNSFLSPEKLPGVFGVKPAVVLSGSMEPAIQTGDLILIRQTDTALLREGDVVCYLASGKAVTHRIVSIATGEDGRPRYITQGDANNTADRLAVTEAQVQGVWKGFRIGGLGSFILFMQTSAGMVLFLVCPLLLFFIWDFSRHYRMKKAETDYTAQLEEELAALKQAAENRREQSSHNN